MKILPESTITRSLIYNRSINRRKNIRREIKYKVPLYRRSFPNLQYMHNINRDLHRCRDIVSPLWVYKQHEDYYS